MKVPMLKKQTLVIGNSGGMDNMISEEVCDRYSFQNRIIDRNVAGKRCETIVGDGLGDEKKSTPEQLKMLLVFADDLHLIVDHSTKVVLTRLHTNFGTHFSFP